VTPGLSEGSKDLFFEKKKQKTFARLVTRWAAAAYARWIERKSKSFLLLFSKKKSFLRFLIH
jgi:hypothetical protein